MSAWDVFRNDRLEVERGLSTEAVRDALAAGIDDEDDSALALPVEEEGADLPQAGLQSDVEIRMNYAPTTLVEDEDEGHEFHLGARGDEKVEELDLTAMVDIAMQLVMFFLVTSTTIFFKSLEIPTPSPEQAKAAQQSPKSLSQLEDTNILVEIDDRGQIQVDHEPITSEALVPKLRAARDATGRTAILLMADYNTLHKTAVRVIEAANEIGLQTQLGRVAGGPGAAAGPGG
jgi:biopolymer transport protein ExbD